MSTQLNHRDYIGVVEWTEKHNLIQELLPFSHRKMDALGVMQNVSTSIESWPKTKQTWTVDQLGLTPTEVRTVSEQSLLLPEFVGCYPVENNSGTRFINPAYVHSVDLTPLHHLSKADHYLALAHTGLYSLRDVAAMYNHVKSAVEQYLKHRGFTWGEERRKGKRKFARTIETIHNWTEYSYRELARMFRLPYGTLSGWIDQIEKPIPDRPYFSQ